MAGDKANVIPVNFGSSRETKEVRECHTCGHCSMSKYDRPKGRCTLQMPTVGDSHEVLHCDPTYRNYWVPRPGRVRRFLDWLI